MANAVKCPDQSNIVEEELIKEGIPDDSIRQDDHNDTTEDVMDRMITRNP